MAQASAKHEELLGMLQEKINVLQKAAGSSTQRIVLRESPEVLDLCYIIERVIHFGLRDLGLLSSTMMWDYAQKVDVCIPNGKEIVRNVKKFSRSTAGRGRTLIRMGLNNNCLDEYFSPLVWNQKLTSTFFTPGSVLRNNTASTRFLDLLMELKDLSFDLPLNREQDATDFWNEYYRAQQRREQQARTHTPVASPVKPPQPKQEVIEVPDRKEVKEMKQDNVHLRVQLEKAQLEKAQLQAEVKKRQQQIEDLSIELEVYKKALGDTIPKDIPSLDAKEMQEIQTQLTSEDTGDDLGWKSSLCSLSDTITNIKNELQGLTESEAMFLSTHVPSAHQSLELSQENTQPDATTNTDGPFNMEIETSIDTPQSLQDD